jgi:hypothetical protein
MEVKPIRGEGPLEYIKSICIGIATGLLVGITWWGSIWVVILSLYPTPFFAPFLLLILVLMLFSFSYIVGYIAGKFLKNSTSGIIYGVVALMVSEFLQFLPLVLIGIPVTSIFPFYLEVIPVLWEVLPRTTFIIVLLTIVKAILFPVLGFDQGRRAQKLIMLQRLKAAGLVSEEAYRRVREELAGDPIFINLYERYFVTICTHKPAIAFKWRELLTYLRQEGRAVKVMMHASYRQDGSLREAYLTAITASYIYIIGKFINTVTSELELQTTLSLIKQLGISVEVREEGDPSYSQIRELFEYAERVESTQPKYTLEEVKNMHYLE